MKFNSDFYPTPLDTIEYMISPYDLYDKFVLEPSSGKGDIIDVLLERGAKVVCCENDKDLADISQKKAKLISRDFLELTADKISHINYIVMNPPFSVDDKHILHAWDIAPDGCEIVALCNYETLQNTFTKNRVKLVNIIDDNGSYSNIGNVFNNADRKTGVQIGLIRLSKPKRGANEFDDFFSDEDDLSEDQVSGIMPFNVVREIVQRYVNAVKLYDEVLLNAVKMNSLVNGLGVRDLVFTLSEGDVQKTRDSFVKDLQKLSWVSVIEKMNLKKFTTSGVKGTINKFVEEQKDLKFTMINIYKMIDMVIQTTNQRMDQAILEVFDELTKHYDENRWDVEGWKTNSHYLVNQKFIKPYMVNMSYYGNIDSNERGSTMLEDLTKALCYITGSNYDKMCTFDIRIRKDEYKLKRNGDYVFVKNKYHDYYNIEYFKSLESIQNFIINNPDQGYTIEYPPTWGKWFDWGFFEVKLFKKGTGHFKFKDENVWMMFNQKVARIKGFSLPENVKK